MIGDAVDTQREGVGGRGFWRRRLDVKGGSGVDMAVSTGNCVILRSHVPDVRADRLKEDLEGLWWGWYDSGWVGDVLEGEHGHRGDIRGWKTLD